VDTSSHPGAGQPPVDGWPRRSHRPLMPNARSSTISAGGRSTVEALADMAERRLPQRTTGRHGWADLLTLVAAVRRLAFDRTLDDADRSRRIRDTFREYDGEFDDDEGGGA
jgi:hypothetical protein